MPLYRNISRHPQDIGGGRMIGVYEQFESDADLSRQVKEGTFLEIPAKSKKKPKSESEEEVNI
jgi:hypothetical protein